MVEHPQVNRLWIMDVLRWRVVAERNDLDSLQPHDAEGFGPAPIVADAHADDRVHRPPHLEALVADVEIALFQMLERRVRQMLGMAGEVDFAVAAENAAVALDQDRRVVAPGLAFLLGQLGIAKVKADAELAR